jgi:hypothetical protein
MRARHGSVVDLQFRPDYGNCGKQQDCGYATHGGSRVLEPNGTNATIAACPAECV